MVPPVARITTLGSLAGVPSAVACAAAPATNAAHSPKLSQRWSDLMVCMSLPSFICVGSMARQIATGANASQRGRWVPLRRQAQDSERLLQLRAHRQAEPQAGGQSLE